MRFILLLLITLSLSSANSRIALLIGNSNYPNKKLTNPINDINLLEKKLNKLHFDVTKKSNLNRTEMIKALRTFYSNISSDTIAIIYFSGHGVHSTIDNKNYLIPIGAFESLLNEADLGNEAISDGKLLASTNGAKFSILLLDACRSNDFAKVKGDKGLGQPQSRLNNDYVISYATEVGKTADDGIRNSPYAKALAEFLTQPYSIGDIFTKVRAKVSHDTKGKQKPYYAPHFENILYLSSKNQPDPTSKWITPTNSTCKANGGKLYKGVCSATWKDAKKICSASGGRLPTIDELKEVVTDCGGIINRDYFGNDAEKNKNNNQYQKCYKKKGFSDSDSHYYWSSPTNAYTNDYGWIVDFNDGYQFTNYNDYSYYVRCVRAGQ